MESASAGASAGSEPGSKGLKEGKRDRLPDEPRHLRRLGGAPAYSLAATLGSC